MILFKQIKYNPHLAPQNNFVATLYVDLLERKKNENEIKLTYNNKFVQINMNSV